MVGVLVIGSGAIGKEYASLLTEFKCAVTLLSRSGNNLDLEETPYSIVVGDALEVSKKFLSQFTYVVIAVQPRFTFEILRRMLDVTDCKILVEKPVSLYASEFSKFNESSFDDKVFVAFNRRQFKSTQEIVSRVKRDEVLSVQVNFTEIPSRMVGSTCEIENWCMCNTIHLFDLVTYLVGYPIQMDVNKCSDDQVCNFFVHGELEHGKIFMNAHWGGPGNWGIQIATKSEKYFLDPLEELRIQSTGAFDKKVIIKREQTVEGRFKPGFYEQVLAFVSEDKSKFISYANYLKLANMIEEIQRG